MLLTVVTAKFYNGHAPLGVHVVSLCLCCFWRLVRSGILGHHLVSAYALAVFGLEFVRTHVQSGKGRDFAVSGSELLSDYTARPFLSPCCLPPQFLQAPRSF